MNNEEKLNEIIKLVKECGDVDGSHHKQWVLDQVLRIALSREEYNEFMAWRIENDYSWDVGVAP